MRLLIFPGIGSPLNTKYSSVYKLITTLALRNGYQDVEGGLIYPGQAVDDSDVLTLAGAVKVSAAFTARLECSTEKYDILGRSFGCVVGLKLVIEKKLQNLQKLILWGPPQYWLLWEMFEIDLARNVRTSAEKGTSIDSTFFASYVPVEYLISRVAHDVVLAAGERDRLCPHDYLTYLSSIAIDHRRLDLGRNITVKDAVQNAEHEITEMASEKMVRDYENALFR